MIKKYLELYKMLLKQNLKMKLEFRTDFYISSLALIIVNLFSCFSTLLLFSQTKEIGDFDKNELFFLYALYLIIISPQQIFFDNLWLAWTHFIDGTFIKYMLRPIDSMFYFVSERIDLKGVGQLVLGIILLVYFAHQLPIIWHLQNIIALLIFIIFGSIIYICIMVIGSSTGFWLSDSLTVLDFLDQIKAYGRYPLDIYGPILKNIFTFILPIGFLGFYPVKFFIDGDFRIVVLTPCIALILIFLSRQIWKIGIKRYIPPGS
ncbi:Conserved membrane hypothetical protein, (ABC-type multidrug transport system, permease component (modular protein)domain) [Pseudolactococcus piscium]|nr:Conserved membrane hypothetical protein, (ABC-type multidrug transport system, permease component (modular protein)domain) [Lactococcus piscium]